MTQRLQSNEIIRFYRSLSLTFLLKNRSVKTRKRSSRNRPLLWFRMGYGPGATVPRGVRSRGYSSRGTSQGQQTPLNRFTGTRENITFPQLPLLVVITEIMRFIQWWIQDFPDRVANPWVFSKNLLLGEIYAENWVKRKEIGPRGGHVSSAPTPCIRRCARAHTHTHTHTHTSHSHLHAHEKHTSSPSWKRNPFALQDIWRTKTDSHDPRHRIFETSLRQKGCKFHGQTGKYYTG